ncbi:MAG: type VI secretion system baseplate subunit TssK [Pirellulaceae bacterium]|nr:type VI secretion system baseplate subunit TssK [Pirellulaceae bacterium]
MRNPDVHWYEGLFLLPQHLQSLERYRNELAHTSAQWDHPYNYGLRALELSREALANNQFEVRTLKARLRDGTVIDLDAGEQLDRLDVKPGAVAAKAGLEDAFVKETVILVYVGVPRLQLGRENVLKPGIPGDARWVETRLEVDDENRTNKANELQFRRLNVRLLLSTQDLSGYELLPIAQIKRASEGEAAPQLDESYIPPLLAIDAWPGLERDIVRAIYDMLGQKIEVLSQQMSNRGLSRDSRDPGDADRIAMLERLNEAYALLGVLAFANGVHPLTAYTELCRLVGQLSIFGPERRVGEIPRYDHDDLARIFKHLKLRLEQLLYAVRDYTFQQRYFLGVGLGMQVSLEPQWFNSDWQWFIGVDKGDLSVQECRDLLSPGQLDWKFGSSRQVEYLFTQRAEGLQLNPMDRPIRALPARANWLYYEVKQAGTSAAWRDVQETQTLALRLRDTLIMNRDRLQGERKLVVSARGKPVTLQFALFAVPIEK